MESVHSMGSHSVYTFHVPKLCSTWCGRKNNPIWEGHSFGSGARTVVGSASPNSDVRAVFSVHHGVVGRTSSLYCWGVYKKWRSPVASQRAFRIRFALSRREAVPDKKTIYHWVSNLDKQEKTLEALKEAIRQEVAAIKPEMILKVMDNYREGLHQCINIQGRHLSDGLFKIRWCKTAFCVLSRNRKTFVVSSLILNLFASQIGEFFLPHPVLWPDDGCWLWDPIECILSTYLDCVLLWPMMAALQPKHVA